MRLWLSFLAAGVLATIPLSGQSHRSGRPAYFPRVPNPQPAVGSGLNGLPGIQPNPGLNGLPSFSRGRIQYPCVGCSPFSRNGGHRRAGVGYRGGGYVFPGIVPVFGNYDFGSTFTSEQQPAPATTDPNALSMAEQIGELRGELNSLKSQAAEKAQVQTPTVASTPISLPVEPATVIVLQNGRKLETTNYAIMDETLWNFSAKPLQKIPLSSIDMTASQKANASRGVDFSVVADSSN